MNNFRLGGWGPGTQPLVFREEDVKEYDEDLAKKEKAQNLDFWKCFKPYADRYLRGKYVVVAKGTLQAIGETKEEISKVCLDTSHHRFIFRVDVDQQSFEKYLIEDIMKIFEAE